MFWALFITYVIIFFMKKELQTKSTAGKIARFFLVTFVILFSLNQAFFIGKMIKGEEQFLPKIVPIMIALSLTGFGSGILALFFGLFAYFKKKDRSVPVILALILGLFALVFIIGEVVIPH